MWKSIRTSLTGEPRESWHLPGYNGILGYRTDSSYETRPADLDADKVQWLENHPDFDLNTERENATKVAQAMKDEGWLFASHTWGHLNVSNVSLERLQTDTQKFKENVDSADWRNGYYYFCIWCRSGRSGGLFG